MALIRFCSKPADLLFFLLGFAPPLILIWFPGRVDEYTFGTWHKGYRIDSHTPARMIAIVGWVLLLLEASVIFDAGWASRFFLGK